MFQHERSGWLKVQALLYSCFGSLPPQVVASPYDIPKILTLGKVSLPIGSGSEIGTVNWVGGS